MKKMLMFLLILVLLGLISIYYVFNSNNNYTFKVNDKNLSPTIENGNFKIDIDLEYFGLSYKYTISVKNLYLQKIETYNDSLYYADYSKNILQDNISERSYKFVNALDIIKLMDISNYEKISDNEYNYLISYEKFNDYNGSNPINYTNRNDFKYVIVNNDFNVILTMNNNLIENILFSLNENVSFNLKFYDYNNSDFEIKFVHQYQEISLNPNINDNNDFIFNNSYNF